MQDLMTRKDVAEFLKIPLRTIDYLVTTGQIPYFRIGKRSVRFSRERLSEYLKERECVEYRTKKNTPVSA
jgi:excisionase family DNA binding protein